jgi:predicted transcriptional regulator
VSNQLKQAEIYHKMGLNTIPLHVPGEEHDNKIYTGKEPRVKTKPYFNRYQTSAEVKKIFTLEEQNNIGIVCGICSKNLVVLDFDSLAKYMDLYRKNSYFRWIADNTILTRTRRGVHVWIRTNVPAKIGKKREFALDIKGQNSHTVEPNSIYKYGRQVGEYLFEHFNEILELPIEKLDFLNVRPSPVSDHNWLNIGHKNHTILQGDKAGYQSRSEAEFSFVLNQISNGEPFDYILELFKRMAADNTHFKENADPIAYLQRTYQNAEKYYLENQRDFDKKINQAMHTVKHLDFRTHSDSFVLLSLLQKARETGKRFIDISIRAIAEAVNISTGGASNSLKRLCDAGFIHKELSGHYDQAARYAILLESLLQNVNTPTHSCSAMVCSPIAINPERDAGKDVFTHYGLGKSGFKVVEALKGGETLSIPEICKCTGLAYNTVKSKLKMLPCEIVKEGRSSVYTLEVNKLDLDQIAERKGVAGRKELLKKRNKMEQVGYQAYLLSDRGKKEESA